MYCLICNSKDKPLKLYPSRDRMYDIKGKFSTEKCPSCGFFTISPKLKKSEVSQYYPSDMYYSYIDNGGSIFRKLRKFLIGQFYKQSILSKIIFLFINTIPAIPPLRDRGKIIDIGCGSGETLRNLKVYGWDVYGVDIDGKAITYAKKSGLPHVYTGGYEYLSRFPDNYFDVIRAYHVIEHMDKPDEFARLSYKKLKKGGEFIIGTPNGRSIAAKLFKSYWYNLDTPRHQYIFSPYNLQLLLKNSGFHSADLRYCSGGGFLGSVQYILSERLHKQLDLINNPFLFFLFYPLDFVSDRMGLGDVFVVTSIKE